MHKKKTKIGFYYLTITNPSTLYNVSNELDRVLDYISNLDRKDRKFDLNANKFCLLDSESRLADTRMLVFESARHSYSAPLMDRTDASKRKNPKKMIEGETMKTHTVVKFKDGDAITVSELSKSGLRVQQIVAYLNHFKTKWVEESKGRQLLYKFNYETIAKDNFQDELRKLRRVVSASLLINKKVLGSDALGFSERTSSVQDDIIIEVKSKRQHTIGPMVQDVVSKLITGTDSSITKVIILGKNEQNNDVKFDTSFIEKREYVEAHLDEGTGEVHSRTMFTEMIEILNS